MKFKIITVLTGIFCGVMSMTAQDGPKEKPFFNGKVSSVEYVTSLMSRPNDLLPAITVEREATDSRSLGNNVLSDAKKETGDDVLAKNRKPEEQTIKASPASLVFDAYASSSQPTDPSLAIGPNHVFVVFNTGFTIYDKSGNQLLGQTAPNPAIFPAGGCCDLTVSYDNAADRWVVTFLSINNGAQIAVSDGPNPLTSGWYVYTISAIQDYQKLSVWSDGYYITENTSGTNKVWALERSAMLAGSPTAKIQGFNLPGLATFGFFSPQALNVTDDNLPAAGGATIVYLQDDAWSGVSTDHIKLWTIDVDWNNANNSTISSPQQINTTPFISVFDNGSFSNLTQPGSGRKINVDALQATIMNQAQFRKFATHNSAVFNFVVDTDGTSGELAGIRWYEFRQNGDNQPWYMYQEGTYTAPNGRHAWHASLAMDGQGNIGMGYTSMSGPNTPTTVYISSYFTGRLSTDPLGTMTIAEELIQNGNGRIPGTRYGDYSKIDVDPNDDSTFWFINEYYRSGRRGVVGVFQIEAGPPDTEAPTDPSNLAVSNITTSSATLSWTASTDNVGVDHYNVFLDGNLVGTTSSTTYNFINLDALTQYDAAVSAQDAAGNESGQATTTFTTLEGGGGNPGEIAAYYFESGLDGWSDPGKDCQWQTSSNSYEGLASVKLRDGSNSSFSASPTLDLSGNSQVTVEFHVYPSGLNNGDAFALEFFNGSSYVVVGQYNFGTDFTNNTFFSGLEVLNSANYNFNANNHFRIRCLANAKNENIWFDQVIVSGDNAAVPIANNRADLESFVNHAQANIKLYPNPANASIEISISDGSFESIELFNYQGKLLKKLDSSEKHFNLDISNYASGMYFVQFVSNGKAYTAKFVKQ